MATVGQWTDAKWSVGFTNTEHWPWDLDVCAARKQCARGAIVGLMRWSGSTRNWSGDQMSPWAESGAHHWTYSDHLVLPEPVQLPDGGKQSLYWYLDAETHSAVIESLGRMPLKQVVALAIDALSGGEVL